jgi:hypothetical protein
MAHVQAFSSFLRVGRQLPRSEAGVQFIRVKSPRRIATCPGLPSLIQSRSKVLANAFATIAIERGDLTGAR